MPDIFGREAGDYEVVRHLQEEDLWERYQHDLAEERGGGIATEHSFTALGAGAPPEQERAAADAQAVGYLTNNLLAIQTMVDEILYTSYRLPRFIALNTAIPEGATSYGVRVRDRRGRAERITAPGYDAPSASVDEFLVTQEIHWYGLDAEWSLDELRGAMFGGVALDTDSIESAVTGTMETMEEVGLTGGDYDEKGLLNQPTSGANKVTKNDASATWKSISTDQAKTIRDEINGEMSAIITESKEAFGRQVNTGLTVYLPGEQYDLLSTLYIGDNAERTLMTSIKEDNPWTNFSGQPISIERVLELEGLGASSSDRMVVSLKNPRVAEMGVSISPRVLRILDKGRVICAQVEAKFSPVFVKRPNIIRYTDKI